MNGLRLKFLCSWLLILACSSALWLGQLKTAWFVILPVGLLLRAWIPRPAKAAWERRFTYTVYAVVILFLPLVWKRVAL